MQAEAVVAAPFEELKVKVCGLEPVVGAGGTYGYNCAAAAAAQIGSHRITLLI